MLKLQFKDRRKPAIWLVDSRYAIGRDQSNDIVLDDEGVAGFHAELQVEDNDRIFLTDAGSAAGTRVNDKPIKARTQLRANDRIHISGVELYLQDPKEELEQAGDDADATAMTPALQGLAAEGGTGAGQEALLRARTGSLVGREFKVPATGHIIIGRSRDCDIVLPSNHVSRQHAQLYFHAGQLWLKDLDSSNGTYVNRKRVDERALNNGDELRFDTLVFEVVAPHLQDSNAESDTTQFRATVADNEPDSSAAAPAAKPAVSAHQADTGAPRKAASSAPAPEAVEAPAKGGAGVLWLTVVVLLIAGVGGATAWWFTRGG